MSNNSDELKIELDDDVASALAAMLFDAPDAIAPHEPDAVIDLRDSVLAPPSPIPDLFATVDTELQTNTTPADPFPPAIPPAIPDSPEPHSRLFPAPPAKPKPVAKSTTPLFPTSATVVRKSGAAGGLFGQTPAPDEASPPAAKSILGPAVRSTPSIVEFVPAEETKGSDYRIVGGLALGVVATVAALAFVFGGGGGAPVTSADVSLIPATQISNTTPTTASVATSLTTAPPTTAAPTSQAPTTEAPIAAAPITAAPVAPAATRPPTTRRPRATVAPATTTPTTVRAATVPTLDIPPATYIVTTTVLPAPAVPDESGAVTATTP